MRRGMLAGLFPLSFPRTLGRDCAGEIDGKLFAGVADMRTDGTHAEYAVLPENQCAPVPEGLDAAGAASLCVAGLSAYIPLVELSSLDKKSKILIHAGAGGVGSVAIQIIEIFAADRFDLFRDCFLGDNFGKSDHPIRYLELSRTRPRIRA